MTQPSPKNKSQIAPIIAAIILMGISMFVGFAAMVMLVVLFIVVVGGPEWGPTLAFFGSPVIGFVVGVGSLVIMGVHAWWWKGKRPFSPSYFFIWIISWLVSLATLAIPFFHSLIATSYYWPEESLGFTIPLSLLVGFFLGVGSNWLVGKR